jgi:hypothetical protein
MEQAQILTLLKNWVNNIKIELVTIFPVLHGQQVSIFSDDSYEVSSSIDILVNQVSRVNINAQGQRGPDVFPFMGRKDSAEGTLSAIDAFRSFSIRSLVATKLNENNKHSLNNIVSHEDSNFLSTKFIF